MPQTRFQSWLYGLSGRQQAVLISSVSALMVVTVFPLLYWLLGGEVNAKLIIAAIGSILIVTPPLVWNRMVLIDIARRHSREAERAAGQVKYRNRVFQLLLESSLAMHRSKQLARLFDEMLTRLERVLPEHAFGIIVDSSRPKIVRYFQSRGLSEQESRILAENNEQLRGQGSEAVRRQLRAADPDLATEWAVLPMKNRHDELIGKLVVKGPPLSMGDYEVLMLFLEQLSVATENRLLALELEKLANTDDLTGIYNRNWFNVELSRQIELKNSNPALNFSIILIDLNGLKELNDGYGHEAGDRLLILAAELLRGAVRREDMVARLGGDEFIIVCPGTDLLQARTLAARIRQRVRDATVPVDGEATGTGEIPMSMSIGVAASHEETPEQTIRLADERMYRDKRRFYSDSRQGPRKQAR